MANPIKTDSEKKSANRYEILLEIIFLAVVFCFIFMWAKKAPFDAFPDESMRFQVVDFIKDNGYLPDGRDPSIRNKNWGISYAFNPITSYIIMAAFAKVASFFNDSFTTMYMAMRMVNVIFGTLTAFLALRIGKRLFEREAAWFFAAMVSFLPGAVFIHAYINMDSIALFSTAWIVYCWVKAIQDGWATKLCVELSVAMSICALSYYNAYGYLLCSALLFAVMMLKCGKKQWNYQEMLKKGIMILAIVFVLVGWWFIRNAILYDGDILGMRASTEASEMYAIKELKPSNRETPQSLGMTVIQMMLWIPGEWKYNWLVTVAVSFVGTFGQMKIFMPKLWSQCYLYFIVVGIIGNVVCLRKNFSVFGTTVSSKTMKDDDGTTIVKTYRRQRVWSAENLMRLCMVIAAVIPFILLVYYAYCSDFQAQGRYIIPSLIPIMYFVTLGYDCLLKKLVKNQTVRKICFGLGTAAAIISSVMVYYFVFAPNY